MQNVGCRCTTSYNPDCDGMVECVNCTPETILRKRVAEFEPHWDHYLPELLWAYRNTPQAHRREAIISFFGWDFHSPIEGALLPMSVDVATTVDVCDELVLTLSSASQSALESIRHAQKRYKRKYDCASDRYQYRIGDWILVHFTSDKSGRLRRLSRPWHISYRVTSCTDTNILVKKVYFPDEGPIQIHHTCVKPCPGGFLAGNYCYGSKIKVPGRSPKWVQDALSEVTAKSRVHQRCRLQPSCQKLESYPRRGHH